MRHKNVTIILQNNNGAYYEFIWSDLCKTVRPELSDGTSGRYAFKRDSGLFKNLKTIDNKAEKLDTKYS